MMRRLALLVLSAVCLHAGLAAQTRADHTHAQHVEQLGSVQFANSCRAEAQEDFLRGLAFLHSFGYEEARRSFLAAAAADPRCAITQWGIAMTYYHPIWAPPTPDELAAGADAAAMAAAIPPGTERERAYVDAIGAFYRDAGKLDHKSRALAYEQSMAGVAARFPEDHEAAIFHALAILGNSPITDKTFAGQKRAAAILNGLLPLEPQHPGITHYLIHAYDYPQLAELALDGARAYAKIAPDSPHALHMPSHIFTRLGMWDESIASNLESARVARELVGRHHPGAESFDALHALDYLEYSYLQTAQDEKARAVVGEIARVDKLDEPNFAAGYALAAVPARWALERRDWAAAKALTVTPQSFPWAKVPYAEAITHFARAVGAARLKDAATARSALARLEKIKADLAQGPAGPYDWVSQIEVQRLAAVGWLARAEGADQEALRNLRAAADLEDARDKHPVTPGSMLPAREQLADLLAELGRAKEALAEYEATLEVTPRRFRSLAGAAAAARNAGDAPKAEKYAGELLQLASHGDGLRPELAAAKSLMAAK
jgi:tetratricopeptide (TPR) repeat protein